MSTSLSEDITTSASQPDDNGWENPLLDEKTLVLLQASMRTPVAMGGPRLDPAFVLDPDAEAAAQQVRRFLEGCAQLENVGRNLLPDPPDPVTQCAKMLRLPVSILRTRRCSVQCRGPSLVVLLAG